MSGFVLKIIALLSMLVDHLNTAGFISQSLLIDLIQLDLPTSYTWIRIVHWFGRLAFPIFAFLIAEGYRHTRSAKKYLGRLLVFAILSEIPFDLALTPIFGEWHNMISLVGHMNVLFTFAFAIIGMELFNGFKAKGRHKALQLVGLAVPAMLAGILGTDYSIWGVLLVYAAYFGTKTAWRIAGMAGILFLLYVVYASSFFINLSVDNFYDWIAACCALLLILGYNRKRGPGSKWLFYVAYPLHLLVIAVCKFVFLA